jgi:pentapeptide MXKDX repeat protein
MKKLMSLLVAAVFAVSSGFAVAASHAGAQPMKKDEMKKGGMKKDAMKKGDKKAAKKAAKKDEMKK